MDELSATLEPAREAWRRANWPGVEEGLSYGAPALKFKGKLLVRVKEPGILVLMCDLEEKEFLMQAAPEIYFETNHYKGWPALLARVENLPLDELSDRAKRTWRSLAPKRLIEEFDARGPNVDGASSS